MELIKTMSGSNGLPSVIPARLPCKKGFRTFSSLQRIILFLKGVLKLITCASIKISYLQVTSLFIIPSLHFQLLMIHPISSAHSQTKCQYLPQTVYKPNSVLVNSHPCLIGCVDYVFSLVVFKSLAVTLISKDYNSLLLNC